MTLQRDIKIGSTQELEDELKKNIPVTCFVLNIDNFSNINYGYGYEAGNELLNIFVEYVDRIKPRSATLYNFYSDKFVLLDYSDYSLRDIAEVAESILSFFSHTEVILKDDIEFKISLSIGISSDTGLINLSQSELAIKELRVYRKNNYNIFDANSEYIQKEHENIYWITKIKDAVSNEDIVAYFQPIVNNHTHKIEKYECLARLRDEETIISPYFFMNAAKMTGNLSYVTKALISQSFKMFSDTEYEFSLNITAEDLIEDYLEEYLLKNVSKYKIDPSRVVLEILEEIESLEKSAIFNQINSLREKGFKIAIDDFGAQNSNMSRLLEINPDYVKIDGAFIKNIVEDEKSQAIVDAIIMICRRSGIKIIAEYIHNEKVQAKVKALGIDYSQGYYFSEPKPYLATLDK